MSLFAPYLAIAGMLFLKRNWRVALNAILFVVLIDAITLVNDAIMLAYTEWLTVAFALIALIFANTSKKASFLTQSPYILYAASYFVITISSMVYPGGFICDNYVNIMYIMLTYLLFSVIYDRMGCCKSGSNHTLL